MTREAGKFDEGFGAKVIRAKPEQPVSDDALAGQEPDAGSGWIAPPVAPLTADDLGALLCQVPYVRISTGEEGVVIVSAEDWQRWMDVHGLMITRRAL